MKKKIGVPSTERLTKEEEAGAKCDTEPNLISHQIDTGETSGYYNSLIVPVFLCHKESPDSSIMVYVLLDDQSNSNFIAQETLTKLKANGQPVKIRLATMLGKQMIGSEVIQGLFVQNPRDGTPIQLPETYTRDMIPADRSLIPRPQTTL